MKTIGIRQLKNEASAIVKTVREKRTEFVVTVRGKPVATLRPYSANDEDDEHRRAVEKELAEMHQLAKEIAAAWKSPLTAAEVVAEQRRTL